MSCKILLNSILILSISVSSASAIDVTCGNATHSVPYSYTGGIQTFTVPTLNPGEVMSNIHIEAYGAQGGSGANGGNSSAGGSGGAGGFIEGDLTLPAEGTILNIFVGGQGSTPTAGFNGGGAGGSQNAGGGGGASDVRLGGTGIADRIIVAGGGGGGGRGGCETASTAAGNGGIGGGGNGANGNDVATPNVAPSGIAGGGQGAVGITGGSRGTGCSGFLGSDGASGTSLTGTGGNGGAGQSCCCPNAQSIPGGGGGGGGYVPGGGGGGGSAGTPACSGNDKGAGGGGAGGTSNSFTLSNANSISGVQNAHGAVNICYSILTKGVDVTPLSGLSTAETGADVTFSVVLTAPPTDDVVIPIASLDSSEGVPTQTSLTFTSLNWDTPQTVTVVGQDDNLADGNVDYTVSVGDVTSADTDYDALDPDDVVITNQDDDTPGAIVDPTSGLTTTEEEASTQFTVVLTAGPLNDVVIPISSSDTTEGTVDVASLTFTPANWNVPQTVTVTGVSDILSDGTVAYSVIVGPATSASSIYNGLDPLDVNLNNTDVSFTCLNRSATILGTNGDDVITGTDGDDVILGLGGNDVINSGKGKDRVCGNDGNDTINGGTSSDRLRGDAGNDILRGSKGKDRLYGKAGRDTLNGGSGVDNCFGGKGNDSASKCESEFGIP